MIIKLSLLQQIPQTPRTTSVINATGLPLSVTDLVSSRKVAYAVADKHNKLHSIFTGLLGVTP